MSIILDALSAVSSLEEACSTISNRVEYLIDEIDYLRKEVVKLVKERDELHRRIAVLEAMKP